MRIIVAISFVLFFCTSRAQMFLPGTEDEVSTLAFTDWQHQNVLTDVNQRRVKTRLVVDAKSKDTLQISRFQKSGLNWFHQEIKDNSILKHLQFNFDNKGRVVSQHYIDASDSSLIVDSVVLTYNDNQLVRKSAWRKLPEGFTRTISQFEDGRLQTVSEHQKKKYGQLQLVQLDSFIYNKNGKVSIIQRSSMFKGRLQRSFARQLYSKTGKKISVIQSDGEGTIIGITRWHYDEKDSLAAYTVVSGAGMKVQLYDTTSYTHYTDGTLKGIERKRNGKLRFLYNYDRVRLNEEAIHFASTGQWTRRTVYNLDTNKRILTQTYTRAPSKPSELQQVLTVTQRFNSSMQLLSQEKRLNGQFVSSFEMQYGETGMLIAEKELTSRGSQLVEKHISYEYWD